MVAFRSERLSPQITRIFGTTDEQMYLIEGTQRAALIDTGSGVGDLKAYIDTLTKLPVDVLITHGHGDHAMGTPQFDRVYISDSERPVYQTLCTDAYRRAYLSGYPRFSELEESDYLEVDDPDRFLSIKDGQIFDLGGITIEAVSCPGHTRGSLFFLLREPRILITGDACNYFVMLKRDSCLGVASYQKCLRAALQRVKGRYDAIYLSHGFVTPPINLLENVLEVCQEVLDGKDDRIPHSYLDTHGLVAKAYGLIPNSPYGLSRYMRLDGGFGNIVYNPDKIYE